jgi:hypothetical protein
MFAARTLSNSEAASHRHMPAELFC